MPSRQPLRGALRAALTAGRFGLLGSPCRKGSICCTQQPVSTGEPAKRPGSRKKKIASGEEGEPPSTRKAERPEGLARERLERHRQHSTTTDALGASQRGVRAFPVHTPTPKCFPPLHGPEKGYLATCETGRPATPPAAGQAANKRRLDPSAKMVDT